MSDQLVRERPVVAAKPLVGTPLERVARLRGVILDGGDQAQVLRRLPSDTVETLIDEGMFRFAMPTELGGENASAVETVVILEAMAAIDASVAWNVMLGSEINAMAAGGMPKAVAKEIFIDNPRVVMCGVGAEEKQVMRKPVRNGSVTFRDPR